MKSSVSEKDGSSENISLISDYCYGNSDADPPAIAAPAPAWASRPDIAQAAVVDLKESVLFALNRDPPLTSRPPSLE